MMSETDSTQGNAIADPPAELALVGLVARSAHSAVDFALETLNELLSQGPHWTPEEESALKVLEGNLAFIRNFLDYSDDIDYDEESKKLIEHAIILRFLATEALDVLTLLLSMQTDKFTVRKTVKAFEDCPVVRVVIQNFIVAENNIRNENITGTRTLDAHPSRSRSAHALILEEENMVGFEDEANIILERLMGTRKQLDVVSVVGMAGIGKTTLARRVYNDPWTEYHFYVRGWASVSQSFSKRDLFIDILGSGSQNENATLNVLSDVQLGERLFQTMKGKRYLIVLDDVWDIKEWKALKMFFPNDNNGSRVLLTTRQMDMALNIKPRNTHPHSLRFLRKDESWELLRQKVFKKESCPQELEEIGKQIAEMCDGLPLAIVLVSGLLIEKERTVDCWMQLNQCLISFVGERKLMGLLDLSFQILPRQLKLCLLYFGAFFGRPETPVWRLISLWMAEGFIEKQLEQRCEDLAEDYLIDLVSRSLVLVDKRRPNGRIKSCHLHDVIREYCVIKVVQRGLLNVTHKSQYEEPSSSSSGPNFTNYRCFHSQFIQFYGPIVDELSLPKLLTNRSYYMRHIRVLIMWDVSLNVFPYVIFHLIHLRYLSLKCLDVQIPPQVSTLFNLETLIYEKPENNMARIVLPYTIWKMVKLRHLRISPCTEIEIPCYETISSYCSILENLQTISWLCVTMYTMLEASTNKKKEIVPCSVEDVLARAPNLKKLSLWLPPNGYNLKKRFHFPDLSHLDQLEIIKFADMSHHCVEMYVPKQYMFPPSLKKLTLTSSHLDWSGMFILGLLPNLEILTLENNYFTGLEWKTSDEGFRRLKFLKLSWMDLQQWITCSSHFPALERLVIYACSDLEEIPIKIGDIATMQSIELYWSSSSAAISLMKIQEKQSNMGNDGLKIIIYPPFKEDDEEEELVQDQEEHNKGSSVDVAKMKEWNNYLRNHVNNPIVKIPPRDPLRKHNMTTRPRIKRYIEIMIGDSEEEENVILLNKTKQLMNKLKMDTIQRSELGDSSELYTVK